MECQRCNELLATFRGAVSLFRMAQRNLEGMVGDDFHIALKKVRLLHEEYTNANAAVMEHWRQEHYQAGGQAPHLGGRL